MLNPFPSPPGDFAGKCILKLFERFSGHCDRKQNFEVFGLKVTQQS